MPQVRIVHPGGPACLMRVYVGENELLAVNKVELVLDAASNTMVGARLTVFDVDLDIIAELGETQTISLAPGGEQPVNGTDPIQPPAGYYRSNLVGPTGRILAVADRVQTTACSRRGLDVEPATLEAGDLET